MVRVHGSGGQRIVLLVRTFLTLEGIAAKADPDFNIYTASLPYAIRRAMAPATPEGRKAMRAAFLNEHDNSVRWERITELVGGAGKSGAGDGTEVAAKTDHEMENEIFADLVSGSSIEPETEINTAADVSLDEAEAAMIAPMAEAADAMLTEVMDTAAAAAASDREEREDMVKEATGYPATNIEGEAKGRGPGREADGRMSISRKRKDDKTKTP